MIQSVGAEISVMGGVILQILEYSHSTMAKQPKLSQVKICMRVTFRIHRKELRFTYALKALNKRNVMLVNHLKKKFLLKFINSFALNCKKMGIM